MNDSVLPNLPAGWSWSRFDEVGSVSLGRQRSPVNHTGPSMRPYVRAANITWSGWDLTDVKEMNFDGADFARFRLLPGDVLINEGSGSAAEVGKPAIWRGEIADCCFQNTLLRIQPRACSPEYTYNYIRSCAKTGQFVASTQGVNIFHIGREGLARHPIPLPPWPEQQRIVTKIDSLSAKSKRASDHLDHAPNLIQKYKQAILSRAFQSSLEKDIARKNIRSISDLILSLDQGWSPKCESEAAKFDNQWAVMKTTAVQSILFEAKENKKLPENLKPRPSLQVSEGDVIITRAGPRNRVGICAYVENTRPNLMICDKVYRLKIDKTCAYPKYITLMLNSPELLSVIEEMKSGINDSGLNLTQSKFLDIEVPCPSLDVQQKVVALVETAFASINRLALEVASARRLVDHLDQAVLSKAFRGELVAQDPNDEPASVLLERIKAEQSGAAPVRRGRGRPRLATAT